MDLMIAEALSAFLVILWFLVSAGGILWIMWVDFLEDKISGYRERKQERRIQKENEEAARLHIIETLWTAVIEIEKEKYG